MTVLAAHNWGTNSKMMADVARLYIASDARVLDATYGKGGFWKKVKPHRLATNDLDPNSPAHHHFDYRLLPWGRGVRGFEGDFDVTVFDPAYVSIGGRETAGMHQMNAAYGMLTTEKSPGLQWSRQIEPGARECARVLREGGLLMWKGQNYISSGRYHDFLSKVTSWFEHNGFDIIDILIFARTKGGPQPRGRRQVHARNNWSFLVIARKGIE